MYTSGASSSSRKRKASDEGVDPRGLRARDARPVPAPPTLNEPAELQVDVTMLDQPHPLTLRMAVDPDMTFAQFQADINYMFDLVDTNETITSLAEVVNFAEHVIPNEVSWRQVVGRYMSRDTYGHRQTLHINLRVTQDVEATADPPLAERSRAEEIANAPRSKSKMPTDDRTFLKMYNIGEGTSGLNVPAHRKVARKYLLTAAEVEDKRGQKESQKMKAARTGLQKRFAHVLRRLYLKDSHKDAWKAFWGLRSHGFPQGPPFNGNEALRFVRKYQKGHDGEVRTGEEIVDEAFKMGYTLTMRTESGVLFGRAEEQDDPDAIGGAENVDDQHNAEDFEEEGSNTALYLASSDGLQPGSSSHRPNGTGTERPYADPQEPTSSQQRGNPSQPELPSDIVEEDLDDLFTDSEPDVDVERNKEQ